MKSVAAEAVDIVLSSLAPSTRKQYESALKQWFVFCSNHEDYDFFTSTRNSVLKLLMQKFDDGASYVTLNNFGSAISMLSQNKKGEDPMICKFLKGTFRSRPTTPKYTHTWDVSIVLNYLKTIDVNDPKTSIKQITEKTFMSIALVPAHKDQTLASIDIINLRFSRAGAVILITEIIKTSVPNLSQPILKLPFFYRF